MKRANRATAVRRPNGKRNRSPSQANVDSGNSRLAYNTSSVNRTASTTINSNPHLDRNELRFNTQSVNSGNSKSNSAKISRNSGITNMLSAVITIVASANRMSG